MKRVTKSVTALLLALVLSLTLLPAQALAADTAPATQTYTGTAYVGAHTNPVYARVWKGVAETSLQTAPSAQTAVAAQAVDYLTETEAVAALRKQMVARKETMTLNVKLPSGTDIEEAVTGIWDKAMEHVSGSGTTGDYLHWQHSGYDCPPVDYWDDDTNITFTVTFQRHPKTSAIWFTTAAQEAALTNYIRNTVLPQLSLSGKTTYQKVQAIYNWITANVKYDYSHLSDPTYLTQYTAYAAAVQKKAVCQGYANLFYRLANDAGVDCRIITGKAYNGTQTEDHAWNIVRMEDEKYYCLDATWDAGLKPENYEYFLKGLTSFSRDHQAETDKLNTPYWTQYQSRTSATDYKASSGPAAPTVTGGNDSQGRPTLKWKAVSGAAKYEVYRARSKDGDYIKYATVTGTSYTNTSYIENGNTYCYKVRALKSDGSYGPYSSVVSVTYRATSSAVPAEVTMGKATAQGSYITVTWDKAANAASYRVYRRVNNSSDWNVVASSVSGTSYTDWNVEPGVRYTYTVRGVAADGQTLSKTYNKTGVTVFATINSNNVASDSLLLKPSVNIPSSLTRMNWDYIGLYYYHGQTINAGLDDFGGMLRLLFNSDGTVYLVSGNGTSRGVYYANDSVISIMFPDDETPQVYMVTFMRTEKYTYLHLMPDASGREALVFSAGSYR